MTKEELRPLTVGVVALQNAGAGAAAWNILFAGSANSSVREAVKACLERQNGCFCKFCTNIRRNFWQRDFTGI